jgi:hypothetical protein
VFLYLLITKCLWLRELLDLNEAIKMPARSILAFALFLSA